MATYASTEVRAAPAVQAAPVTKADRNADPDVTTWHGHAEAKEFIRSFRFHGRGGWVCVRGGTRLRDPADKLREEPDTCYVRVTRQEAIKYIDAIFAGCADPADRIRISHDSYTLFVG